VPVDDGGTRWPAGIGAPAARALGEAGWSSLADLTAVREQDVAALHGVGPKAVRILRQALQDAGLAFRRDVGG
jgi:predicted flap endonuclease-1-like 5' DNA nuclease